jgi:ATP sulfurylase
LAKLIVSKELVFEVASQLLKENIEPSNLNVQNRIGKGSFSTVKRFLNKRQAQAVSVPRR